MLNDTYALPQFTLTTRKIHLWDLCTGLRSLSVYGEKWSVGPHVFQISSYFMPVNFSVLMVRFVSFIGFSLYVIFQFNV